MNFISRFRRKKEAAAADAAQTTATNNTSKTNTHNRRSRKSHSNSFRRLHPIDSTTSMVGYSFTDEESDDVFDDTDTSTNDGSDGDGDILRATPATPTTHTTTTRKESIARLFVRVVPGGPTTTGRDKVDLTRRSQARSRSSSRSTTRKSTSLATTTTMLSSDRTELDALFNQAEDEALQVFQHKLSANFDAIESQVCTELIAWETALSKNDLKNDPVSQLQEHLTELDGDLEDAIRKLDDSMRSMYEFRNETKDVDVVLQRVLLKSNTERAARVGNIKRR